MGLKCEPHPSLLATPISPPPLGGDCVLISSSLALPFDVPQLMLHSHFVHHHLSIPLQMQILSLFFILV